MIFREGVFSDTQRVGAKNWAKKFEPLLFQRTCPAFSERFSNQTLGDKKFLPGVCYSRDK